MRVGFIQFDPKFGDKEANLEKISQLASSVSADLLVLPEMCTTGYMVKDRKELALLAEVVPDSLTIERLQGIARQNKVCLIVGMPEIDGNKIFSTAVAVGPEGLIHKHQKSHLFLKEKILFDPGTTKIKTFQWQGATIGLGVCYDYMFPEFWRKLALEDADLFCNPANFVFDYGFKMMRARSIENGVFSITVNRIGEERGQGFNGGSEIVDNRGNMLKKSGNKEKCFVIDLDLSKSRNKKWNFYNHLIKDRRIDLY